MQTEENSRCDSESPSARVSDIRRQWALHEDEALAHRLQDEEITQHYAGNRTRNAIVRGDAPHAREEQRREEQEALEQRLKHLSLLQRQAEDDARVAQQLARKYQASNEEAFPHPEHLEENENEDIIDMRIGPEVLRPTHSKVDSSLLGAACVPCSSSQAKAFYTEDEDVTEDDVRLWQEQKDEELARKVQDELQQYEKDRKLAIEAQDRELAKVLYEKEKARLKRAKERARLKAEAAAAANGGCGDGVTSSDSDSRAVSRNSVESVDKRSTDMKSPPRVPEKSSFSKDNFIGFKANPKALPPQPQSSSSSRRSYSDEDPVPPYMPIHGFNRNSPKRSNK